MKRKERFFEIIANVSFRPIADISGGWQRQGPILLAVLLGVRHSILMKPRYRHAELLSSDAKLRLAIYDREDLRFQIVEERVRSYEAGDESRPDYVSFPSRGGDWRSFWQIDAQPRDGLFGSLDDALREAKQALANGN